MGSPWTDSGGGGRDLYEILPPSSCGVWGAEEEGVYSVVKKIFTEDVQSSAREGMSVLQYVGRNGLIGP